MNIFDINAKNMLKNLLFKFVVLISMGLVILFLLMILKNISKLHFMQFSIVFFFL